MKVAGLVSGPRAPAHGTVYNGLMHISDWYPTILRAAGIRKLRGITLDGFDHWRAMKGREPSPRTVSWYTATTADSSSNNWSLNDYSLLRVSALRSAFIKELFTQP